MLDDDEQSSVRKWRDLFGDGFGSLSPTPGIASTAAMPRVVRTSKPYATASVRNAQSQLRLKHADFEWLTANFPGVRHDPDARIIVGELELHAAYDSGLEKLRIGNDDDTKSMDSYLCDSFCIRIELEALEHNGWPTVCEVGGRNIQIADRERVDIIDLHFYPDGACCLGLQLFTDRRLTLKEFIDELVVPFFIPTLIH